MSDKFNRWAKWSLFIILDHYTKVKTYLGKLKKFEVMLSTKKN